VQVRRQYVLFFVLVAAVVAAGFWQGRRNRTAVDVLSAVPADAWLVASVDVEALRASPIAQPLLGPAGEAGGAGKGSASAVIQGLGTLTEACGFDPVARIDQVVLCSPEGGERGDFGVALTGRFTRDELTQCADKISRARGGKPETSRRGAFAILEDKADAAHTRFAYREGGPFLVGRGAWLDAMIDAAEASSARERPEHAALRQSLAPKPGEARRSIVVTALLPSSVRDRLRAELGAELGSDGERAYASVLAVASAGFALGTGGPGSATDLAVELRCDSADACAEVKTLLERKRLGFSRDLGLRLVGVGPLIDSLQVTVQGPSLSATAHAPTDDLARAARRVLDFRSAPRRPADAHPDGAPTPSNSAAVDGGWPARTPAATTFDTGASKY
jgi:hypothetical protein